MLRATTDQLRSPQTPKLQHQEFDINANYDIDQHGYSQALLHHVHSPDEQVGVAHRAAAHAAGDLYEAGASRVVLELHLKHTL